MSWRWIIVAAIVGLGLWECLDHSTLALAQEGDDPTAGQNSSPARPAYKSLRYDEDYSFLSDPAQRSDWLDSLKYIPMGAMDGRYLSIGGELRERYEFYHNEDFGG